MTPTRICFSVLLASVVSGCSFDEGLQIEDLIGTVVIPADLVTRDYIIGTDTVSVTDVKSIGPVYLGLFSGVEAEQIVERYPHPKVGPLFGSPLGIGDTYPYGGTTIGEFKNTCLAELNCRLTTGRFVDYDEIVDWFSKNLGQEIQDYNGAPVESGEYLRQTCFAEFNFTNDKELDWIVHSDENHDDTIDAADLDFVVREDGNFEASFTMWQQEYFENKAEEEGFTLWGFMDAPAPGGGLFGTCSANNGLGRRIRSYNQDFRVGAPYRDVLNHPSQYIGVGDVVSGVQDETGEYGFNYSDIGDIPELWLNFEVQ